MEKVWDELKKIEAQAEAIRSEAQNNAKEITAFAQQEAQKLQTNSKAYAEQEAQQIYNDALAEANRNRELELQVNKETTERLVQRARQRMEKAKRVIVASVLGET